MFVLVPVSFTFYNNYVYASLFISDVSTVNKVIKKNLNVVKNLKSLLICSEILQNIEY